MIKCIIIGNFRGTCASVECWRVTYLSVEMLKWYMLICRNAEGVYGKRKVGNPCSWRTHLPLALYNYKLIHFSSHSSDYHGTRSSNYRRNNSNRNSLRNTCCFYVIACMKRFLSMPLWLMNRNGFIEKRHSARVSCSLSTICSLQLKCNTHNVTDHYTTSYNPACCGSTATLPVGRGDNGSGVQVSTPAELCVSFWSGWITFSLCH